MIRFKLPDAYGVFEFEFRLPDENGVFEFVRAQNTRNEDMTRLLNLDPPPRLRSDAEGHLFARLSYCVNLGRS